MPRQAQPKDNTLLEMAIVGYQSEIERVSARIADIKAQLGQRGPGRPKLADIKAQLGQRGPGRPKVTVAAATVVTATDQAAPANRRTISKAGRARIAAAQRARGATQKKQQAQPAQPAKPTKRKLSAAGKRAIIAATKKRWVAYRKAQKAAK